MASSIHSVPLSSTAQMPPVAAPLQTPTSGIRAPLTLDESDFEYSASSKSRRNSTASSYYSGSELESDGGFVSGGDESESETDSGRLVVHDPDEEILEETRFVKEYTFSRSLVKNPNGNIVKRSSSIPKIDFLVPPLKIPDREIIQESGSGSRNAFSGPYISDFNEYDDSDEEIVKEDDYVVNYGDSRPLVSVTNKDVVENSIVGVSSVSILHRPIALISGDNDDDVSEGSVVMEDDDFSGVVRVPSIELLRRINRAPKVRILDVEEVEENESEDGSTLEREDNEELVLSNGVLGLNHEEQINTEETVQDVLSSNMSQNEGPDFNEDFIANSLVVKEENNEELVCNNGVLGNKHDGDQINVEETVESDLSANMSQDEGLGFNKELSVNSLAVNEENNCMLDSEWNEDSIQINEDEQELDAIGDKRNCVDSDDFVSGHGFESRKLGNENESGYQKGDQRVWFLNSIPESVDQAIEMKNAQSNDFPQFSEYSETVTNHVETFDTVFQTGRSDFCLPVLSKTVSDQGINSKVEITEAENLTFEAEPVLLEIESEEASVSDHGGENLRDYWEEIDDKIVSDGGKMNDSSVKDVSDVDNAEFTCVDCTEIFPLEIDSTVPVCEARNPDILSPLTGELEKALNEGENKNLEQIEHIRVKYLWLLHKLGRSREDSVAMELEEQIKSDSDSSLSILVIGKTGVGKSATINSIFCEKKTETNAFDPATENVKETTATVHGLEVKVLDTPGLRTSLIDQSINRKILSSIKKSIQKSPPDVVLYVDRLDMQTYDFTDMPLLRLITGYLGSSIWHNSIIVLTHAASLPPDEYSLGYELFVDQRSSVLQKTIRHLVADSVYPDTLVPLSLVENGSLDRTNECGEKLLFLCYSMKILLELNSVAATTDLGLSFMRWRGDLIRECNLQSKFGVGTRSKLCVTAELNEKLSGRVSIKTRGSDQLQIAVLALLLISKALSGNVFP